MKKDIYVIFSTRVKNGEIIQEEDLQFFDDNFSISEERCAELCKEFSLLDITFLKIGTADFFADYTKLND